LEAIFDSPIDTKEGDEAEILSLLIENYENKHYPIEAIKIRMEELNMRQKDLIGIIGGKSRVSEILKSKEKIDRRYDKRIGENTSNFSFSFSQ
jgi:HTH-type transcriptional regulator/antitoxin HigA